MQGESKPEDLCFAAKEVKNHADLENDLETSAVLRKRCKNTSTSAAYEQKSPPKRLKNRGHIKDTISVPMGVSERQKVPSEPSDYLGLRVSHSLSRQRWRV